MKKLERYALLSVSDKRGIIFLAKNLINYGFAIISTGGTARVLKNEGLPVIDISEYTNFPEILNGRVKSIHPMIHAGILADRTNPEHIETLKDLKIPFIDIVVVNFYPFPDGITEYISTDLTEAIEKIDIGGPTLARAAAKNYGNEHHGVTVIVDPNDYQTVIDELSRQGAVTLPTRFRLALKAFNYTARYDILISNFFAHHSDRDSWPSTLLLSFELTKTLRYGENPHQLAALYRDPAAQDSSLATAQQLQGKDLSYNNFLDSDTAWNCVRTFDPITDGPACVIVKHAGPCGAALGATAEEAYQRAFSADPTSAFGGVIAFNTCVDSGTAKRILDKFVELIIAPEFEEEALTLFAAKKNLRVLRCPLPSELRHQIDLKRIDGGILAQTLDNLLYDPHRLRVVTKRSPTEKEEKDLLFAWRIAQYAKSNAIVIAKECQTCGIGAGQSSRVDAARIAVEKAMSNGHHLHGSVAASDAFFPFRDGLDIVAKAGVTAVIQPGGSVRDNEVIAAANEYSIAMLFTGIRHFRH